LIFYEVSDIAVYELMQVRKDTPSPSSKKYLQNNKKVKEYVYVTVNQAELKRFTVN